MVVLVLGMPMVDVTVRRPDLIEKYELVRDGATQISEKTIGLITEALQDPNVTQTIGGSSTNAAKLLRYSSPNTEVVVVGSVGTDCLGEQIKSTLEDLGLTIRNEVIPAPARTATCVTVLDGAVRCLVCHRSAAQDLSASYVNAACNEFLEKLTHIYVTGYLLRSKEMWDLVVSFMTRNNIGFSMNLSAEYVCKNLTDEINNTLNMDILKVLFGNSREYLTLCQKLGVVPESYSNAEGAVQLLSQRHSHVWLICTQDKDPVIAAKNGDIKHEHVAEVPVMVDSSCAGDAFVGGFLGEYLEGGESAAAVYRGLSRGVEIAANVLGRPGCQLDNEPSLSHCGEDTCSYCVGFADLINNNGAGKVLRSVENVGGGKLAV